MGQAFGEDATDAGSIVAEEFPHLEMESEGVLCQAQVLQGALIAAVNSTAEAAANRAMRGCLGRRDGDVDLSLISIEIIVFQSELLNVGQEMEQQFYRRLRLEKEDILIMTRLHQKLGRALPC